MLAGVEAEPLGVGKPKWAAGLGAEVPLDDGADVGVKGGAGGRDRSGRNAHWPSAAIAKRVLREAM